MLNTVETVLRSLFCPKVFSQSSVHASTIIQYIARWGARKFQFKKVSSCRKRLGTAT